MVEWEKAQSIVDKLEEQYQNEAWYWDAFPVSCREGWKVRMEVREAGRNLAPTQFDGMPVEVRVRS